MNRVKYIVRGSLLLLTVLLIGNLYRKTEDNFTQIAKFKLETANKIMKDSLRADQKIDLLIDQTTEFNKQFVANEPPVRNGLRYLIGAVGVLIVVELYFFISGRRRPGP